MARHLPRLLVCTLSRHRQTEGTAARRERRVMRLDVAYDSRRTSHMSVGMQQYAFELQARMRRIAADLSFETFGKGDNFDWGEQIAMPLWIRKAAPRLVHFPSPYAPTVVPAPYVVTIHDLIDLHYPQWTKPNARWYYQVVVRRLARRARCVITDDDGTADDIARFYGVARERVAVIPLGIEASGVRPAVHPRPYAIYAGNRRSHKDLPTLVEAWRRVDAARPLDLVLTGEPDVQLADARREGGRIVFLGNLEHGDVLRWIAGAAMLTHAALREGFGLPLLEAAKLGTPVVACGSAVPVPLREAVRTFPAGDAAAMTRAIEETLDDRSGELVRKARLVADALTWDRCVQRTVEVYRRFL
ncbi:MAG: glycosyltransferase family 4 protein [Vulcanimicrobiaceae bacterium]